MRCLDAWMRREASSRCLIVSLRTEFSLGMRQLYTLLSACCVGLGRCGLLRIRLPRTRVNNPLSDAPSEAPNPFLFPPGPLPYGGSQTLDPDVRGDIASRVSHLVGAGRTGGFFTEVHVEVLV